MMMMMPSSSSFGDGETLYAPTVRPERFFNAQHDCKLLRSAMKGLGTDEAALINVLCRRSWQQRNEIERAYQQMYGRDLENDIKDDTSGKFLKVLTRLLKTPAELAAFELYNAISPNNNNNNNTDASSSPSEAASGDEDCLIEIICTSKSSQELREIGGKYKQVYGRSLEEDISRSTTGCFRRFLISLLTSDRPTTADNSNSTAADDARILFEGAGKQDDAGTTRFNAIFCTRSYSQLRTTFDILSRHYKTDICDAIKSEFSGTNIGNALLAHVASSQNRCGYFASRLYAAMEGPGTRNEKLLRIIVSRCDFDLEAIKKEYARKYGKSLWSTIEACFIIIYGAFVFLIIIIFPVVISLSKRSRKKRLATLRRLCLL